MCNRMLFTPSHFFYIIAGTRIPGKHRETNQGVAEEDRTKLVAGMFGEAGVDVWKMTFVAGS